MTQDPAPAFPVTTGISRDHWTVPAPGPHPQAHGTLTLAAHPDGTTTLRLARDPTAGGDQQIAVLDVSTAAQLSVGIWEAAGLAQQLSTGLRGDRPPPPRRPTGSGQPPGNLAGAPAPRGRPPRPTTPRSRPRGDGAGPAAGNGGATVDAEDARTIGRRIRWIRQARGKSLRVIAGLAGAMSSSTLHRIEHGRRAVTLPEIVALAGALQVPPSELTRLPLPTPANGHTDTTTEALRLALDAIETGRPDGLVLPAAALREQVSRIHTQRRACQFTEVATELPGLVRNLHTTLATGTDHGELLDLAVYLHVHITRLWLVHSSAPDDLIRRTVFLVRRLAQERDHITTLAMAGFSVADTLLCGGAIELGRAELDSLTPPPTTAGTAGLVCNLALGHAHAAVLAGRPDDAVAPIDTAAEVAEQFGATGKTDSRGFIHAPADVGLHRMGLALEVNEPDQAVRTAQNVAPECHPFRVGRAQYWAHYGRALSQLRGRHDDAVRALRTAEDLFPTLVHRNPMVRDAIAALLPGTHRDATGRELRGLAHRANVPV